MLWTVAHQVPLSIGFSRQEYWNGLPFPPPGDLSDPGIEPEFPVPPALAGGSFTASATWEVPPHPHLPYPASLPQNTYLLLIFIICFSIVVSFLEYKQQGGRKPCLLLFKNLFIFGCAGSLLLLQSLDLCCCCSLWVFVAVAVFP